MGEAAITPYTYEQTDVQMPKSNHKAAAMNFEIRNLGSCKLRLIAHATFRFRSPLFACGNGRDELSGHRRSVSREWISTLLYCA
ncbi:hypothetical protein EVAR_24658_1 [Eumeta japonica]|uniref:Uncharacterized protein n=1 Tax=Eumeta variegata TaxID=151549 RepID=A0A4C1V325_EUMVA|nr:hypothetical protein EVAR_24658_1 [Eumeta japonica]